MDTLHSQETLSVWHNQKDSIYLPPLDRHIETDVCIIGGGIAGLTTAYMLLQEGLEVIVVDKSTFCKGQSGRSTAHLTAVLDERYCDLEQLHGPAGMRLIANSHLEALNQIKKIIADETIQCDLRTVTGYLFSAYDEDLSDLKREYTAAKRAGLNVQLVETLPLSTFRSGPALAFTDQYEMNPLLYLKGLTQAILRKGGKIFFETEVSDIAMSQPARVTTRSGFHITCDSVVLATHSPIKDLFGLHTKQSAYRTYVMSLEVPKGSIPHILCWDTSDPYHYFRITEHSPSHDLLIVGGEDHKTGQETHPELSFGRIEAWARHRFPMAEKVVHRWSGQLLESIDGLAFLGRSTLGPQNLYVITGDSGNGLTNCTTGAKLIADQIAKRQNPYEKLYSPSRIPLKHLEEFIRTNSNVLSQYGRWFSSQNKPPFSKMPFNSGAVYRDGLKMMAAYKSPRGDISLMSAVCPHLGGIVQWNSVEKSWDCPCHGSRFNCYGEAIEGPSLEGLSRVSPTTITESDEPSQQPPVFSGPP